jgi:hypothetical protein
MTDESVVIYFHRGRDERKANESNQHGSLLVTQLITNTGIMKVILTFRAIPNWS